MIYNRYHIGIIILTVLSISCSDQSQFYYPNEVVFVTGRGTHPRFEGIMDSTINGVPMVIGSEWVYADSFSLSPAHWYHDTIRIRLASVAGDSANGFRYTYQGFRHNAMDTFFLRVQGNTLYSGYMVGVDTEFVGVLWGDGLIYQFPLTVGRVWSTLFLRVWVSGKEKITVKAGTFDTYVIKSFIRSIPMEKSDRWYTPRVGIISVSDTIENFIENAELLSYHIGPGRK